MSFFNWIESRIKTFTLWDMGIMKVCVISFTLAAAKLWPPLLKPDWKVYGLVFIATYIYLIYKVYIKK